MAHRRFYAVGPTAFCPVGQRWPNGGKPPVGQRWANVGPTAENRAGGPTLGQRWANGAEPPVGQRWPNGAKPPVGQRWATGGPTLGQRWANVGPPAQNHQWANVGPPVGQRWPTVKEAGQSHHMHYVVFISSSQVLTSPFWVCHQCTSPNQQKNTIQRVADFYRRLLVHLISRNKLLSAFIK